MPTRFTTRLEDFDKMLQKKKSGFTGLDGEVLLYLLPMLASERWIRQHHVVAVLLLNVGEVFGESIDVADIWRLNAVQNHVHDGDDIGKGFYFLAVNVWFWSVEILVESLALDSNNCTIHEKPADRERRHRPSL